MWCVVVVGDCCGDCFVLVFFYFDFRIYCGVDFVFVNDCVVVGFDGTLARRRIDYFKFGFVFSWRFDRVGGIL